MFRGLMAMNEGCPDCRLKYEREPGYFLGSTYVNYAATGILLLIAYVVGRQALGWTNRQLVWPLLGLVVLFPLFFFRYARALWLGLDLYFDWSGGGKDEDRVD